MGLSQVPFWLRFFSDSKLTYFHMVSTYSFFSWCNQLINRESCSGLWALASVRWLCLSITSCVDLALKEQTDPSSAVHLTHGSFLHLQLHLVCRITLKTGVISRTTRRKKKKKASFQLVCAVQGLRKKFSMYPVVSQTATQMWRPSWQDESILLGLFPSADIAYIR